MMQVGPASWLGHGLVDTAPGMIYKRRFDLDTSLSSGRFTVRAETFVRQQGGSRGWAPEDTGSAG